VGDRQPNRLAAAFACGLLGLCSGWVSGTGSAGSQFWRPPQHPTHGGVSSRSDSNGYGQSGLPNVQNRFSLALLQPNQAHDPLLSWEVAPLDDQEVRCVLAATGSERREVSDCAARLGHGLQF
jgi:hypothetical protein